jgi:hypothetical protein
VQSPGFHPQNCQNKRKQNKQNQKQKSLKQQNERCSEKVLVDCKDV